MPWSPPPREHGRRSRSSGPRPAPVYIVDKPKRSYEWVLWAVIGVLLLLAAHSVLVRVLVALIALGLVVRSAERS